VPPVVRSVPCAVRVMLLLFATTPLVAACSTSTDSPKTEDGVGETQLAASVVPLGAGCATPNEGCPCDGEGMEVTCKGPEVTTGNYTTCTPGVRFCTDGSWGACVGKTLYESVDALSQEYASPCPDDGHVRWGSLTLEGNTPANSSVGVSVQTAATEAGLDQAPLTPVAAYDATAPSPWPAIDVDAALSLHGQASATWLRVTIALGKATPTSASPSVAWQQASQCVAMMQ
jgi:hypothetical protein